MVREIINKNFTFSQKILLVLFLIMAIGLVTFLLSPFILIWVSWGVAWRVGATGIALSTIPFLGWWVIYNVLCATKKSIGHEEKGN